MPGGDLLPIYCPACDKQGVSSKMMKVLHSAAEGMRVKCVAHGHLYAYDRLMQLNPRKEKLILREKKPEGAEEHVIWAYPQVWAALSHRFPDNLMTTLCATLTALGDADTVMVEGNFGREMRELGVQRGKDVLGLAKRVKELQQEVDEMKIRERALAPLLKALGGTLGVQQATPQQEPSAMVDGHRNPELPNVGHQEELVEDPESGLLVPASEFASAAPQRQLPQLPPLQGSVNEARPSFVRRLT